MSKNSKILYDIITKNDAEAVMCFLKRTFFLYEPMNQCVELGSDCKDTQEYCQNYLDSGFSMKAVDENKNIVGCMISGIIKKPLPGEKRVPLPEITKSEKLKKILTIIEYTANNYDMFKEFPNIDSYLDGKVISVDPDYGGKGIAGQLLQKTIELMKEKNIQYMYVLCSSNYSARVCEKENFFEGFRVNFADFLVNGKQLLNPQKPHDAIRVMIKDVTK